jgi:hypothetical protein
MFYDLHAYKFPHRTYLYPVVSAMNPKVKYKFRFIFYKNKKVKVKLSL